MDCEREILNAVYSNYDVSFELFKHFYMDGNIKMMDLMLEKQKNGFENVFDSCKEFLYFYFEYINSEYTYLKTYLIDISGIYCSDSKFFKYVFRQLDCNEIVRCINAFEVKYRYYIHEIYLSLLQNKQINLDDFKQIELLLEENYQPDTGIAPKNKHQIIEKLINYDNIGDYINERFNRIEYFNQDIAIHIFSKTNEIDFTKIFIQLKKVVYDTIPIKLIKFMSKKVDVSKLGLYYIIEVWTLYYREHSYDMVMIMMQILYECFKECHKINQSKCIWKDLIKYKINLFMLFDELYHKYQDDPICDLNVFTVTLFEYFL